MTAVTSAPSATFLAAAEAAEPPRALRPRLIIGDAFPQKRLAPRRREHAAVAT